jgi:hypothetical protein
MSAQHTPGPWQVRPSTNEITNADHGSLPFAIVAGYTLIGATYENGKDARLIAAAPDLLKALRRFASKHRHTYGLDGAWDEEITMAEAAIAKATGDA